MTVMDAIRNRRSVRSFSDRAIPETDLQRMREALRLAPSACNNQPWRFIFVTMESLRAQVAAAARKQDFIAEAPVIVVGVGFPDKAYKQMGGHGNSVEVDVAIAMDHLTLAAAEAGLGTCWIGAFDEGAVKRLLNIPAEAKVVALTPLGYPDGPDLISPAPESRRKPLAEVVVEERF